MKKISAVLIVISVFFSMIYAQASSDPTDSFYSLVERWESMRIISEQPPLRPYPLKLIDEILTEVAQGDFGAESEAAAECFERIHRRPIKVSAFGDGTVRFAQDDIKYQIVGGGHLNGDFALPKWISMGYSLGAIVTNDNTYKSLPLYTVQPYFYRDEINLKSLMAYLDADTNAAFNYEFLYLQAGINHSSFGPFYNNSAIINPNAKHTANFSMLLKGKRISYTEGFFGLSATSPDPIPSLAYATPIFSKKFLGMHSLNGQIFEWLSASFYEVVIYGERFEPAYLAPAPYIITQGLLGLDDNIFMGINFTLRPIKNLSWKNDFFIDDMELSQLLKLNFDTKIRGTFQSEIKYVFAELPVLDTLKVNYTMVTPYMYAHWQNLSDPVDGTIKLGGIHAINYQEYTTAGEPLGLSLPPNTEKIDLTLSVSPLKRLKITGRGSYSRHANVCEGLTEEEMLAYLNTEDGFYSTDGGIHTHQQIVTDFYGIKDFQRYIPSAWNSFLFLTQPTKMHTFQAGLDIDYETPYTKYGRLIVSVGYTFEHIINYGVDNNIFIGKGKGNATVEDVYSSLLTWRSKLCDRTNHFVRAAIKYEW